MKPDRESASLLAEAFADTPDFATEHCDLTVGDNERGGPEGIPEPESPKGYGGADIHRSRRPKAGHKQVVMALREPHPAPPQPPHEARPIASPDALRAALPDPLPGAPPDPVPGAPPDTPPEALAEALPDALPEAEPDFALEHRHLTVGGSDQYLDRRH